MNFVAHSALFTFCIRRKKCDAFQYISICVTIQYTQRALVQNKIKSPVERSNSIYSMFVSQRSDT